MKSKIIASTLLGIGFLIGASALSALAVWTGAPGAPTDCPTSIDGCNAPIHVGIVGQNKLGSLSTIGFSTIGGFNFLPSASVSDQPTAGQVLMADSSNVIVNGNSVSGLTVGKVKWGNVSAAAFGWVTIDSGGIVDESVESLRSVYWPLSGVDHSPNKMCQNAGYSFASGPIRYDANDYNTNLPHKYYSTIVSGGDGVDLFYRITSPLGPVGWSSFATADAQILCVK